METWKEILGYEDLYKISSLGRVVSLERTDSLGRCVSEKIRATQIKNNGYEKVDLSKKGIVRTFHVHRLVAEAFLGRIPNNMEVSHNNHMRSDNRVSNLSIISHSENMASSIQSGRNSKGPNHQIKNRGDKSTNSKITQNQAVLIKESLLKGYSLISISNQMGVSYDIVRSIKLGKSWKWLNVTY